MKKLILLIAIFVVFISCNIFDFSDDDTSIDYDSIVLDTFIVNNYSEDALELYFREIKADSTHPNYNNPIFDTNEVEKVLKIIQAVYDSDLSQRDIVFKTYNIHAFSRYDFNTIILGVDTGATEIKNLISGNIPTGNDDLDSILINFHFDSVETFNMISPIIIYSSENYNLLPIMNELENIPSITYAEPCFYGGDGNNITLNRKIDSPKITFSIGYGDCMAGCIHREHWEFQIVGNKAKFVRSY